MKGAHTISLIKEHKNTRHNQSLELRVADPIPPSALRSIRQGSSCVHTRPRGVHVRHRSELPRFGCQETLRRIRRLVNNTLRARPELQRLIVSCVLPRHINRRLDHPNDDFVGWFNREAQELNDTIRRYCRRPSKLTYLDYGFESLPPRRFLAADGLHPSFSGVALMAQTFKTVLRRGKMETAPGCSTQAASPRSMPPSVREPQANITGHPITSPAVAASSSETQRATIEETVRSQDSGAQTTRTDTGYPTIAENLTPRPCHQQHTTVRRYNLRNSAMPSPRPKED
ncbi:hypothetical protein HPB50_026688 [Hyalomma asiaticum]|uniref:Uncharacterized protein n=1 Tax=Hyalomma asiaticum TaxID=266040 RepID=A0ACB7TPP0_HYAAI|nr:hypothetical protein HPB50_026688 [Hyalomma asiaticum]